MMSKGIQSFLELNRFICKGFFRIEVMIRINQAILLFLLILYPLMALGTEKSSGEATDLKEEVALLKAKIKQLEELVDKLGKRNEPVQVRLPLGLYKLPDSLEFAGEKVPLDRWDIKERLELEFLLMMGNEPQVILYLKRSTRYFPLIEKILRDHKMPDDLKYVAVVESALKPTITSFAGAVGPWQFITATGKRYSLQRYSWLDERRNIEKASIAAVGYLSDLYQMFGSWTMALAAYNAGEARVARELKEQGVNNYFQLMLPAETERYYFKVLSAKIILSDPEKYGFYLPKEDYYQPSETDVVRIEVKESQLPIRTIAEANGSFYRELKKLNPELTEDYLPRGVYELYMPRRGQEAVYKVKRGDTLAKIASQFDTDVTSLQQWNKLKDQNHIYPGQKLIIKGTLANN